MARGQHTALAASVETSTLLGAPHHVNVPDEITPPRGCMASGLKARTTVDAPGF